MRGLYVVPELPWPLLSGQAVMAHHLMHGLSQRGHSLHLAVARRPDQSALEDWPLRDRVTIEPLVGLDAPRPPRDRTGYLHRRWTRYWGWPSSAAAAVAQVARRFRADYVQAVGMNVLPLVTAVPDRLPVIWMAGDDWCLHHLTLIPTARTLRERLRTLGTAAVMAAYERSFAGRVDAAVAVSPRDERALRNFGGFRRSVTIRLGVDAQQFRPRADPTTPLSVMFWGRLDFKPNVDAVLWFARHVWPKLVQRDRDARWWIIGPGASNSLCATVGAQRGIEMPGFVDDIRPWVGRASVVVLPLVSGAGIKDKLLEASAMGCAVIATPRTVSGLVYEGQPPWVIAKHPTEWIAHIRRLWSEPETRRRLGEAAREWVIKHHDLRSVAERHEQLIQSCRNRTALRVVPDPGHERRLSDEKVAA